MSGVYYNDNEDFVCDWLENLIREKLLPAGVVDRRPIQEVRPEDVQSFTQCHFFAGTGGWAYALQLAGWGDRPVWTGSCPCQPFSTAGKGQAEDDPRHLWPSWFRLIRECRPERVFGEQVASGIGFGWLDMVSTDLEAEAYTVGAVVLGAHSVRAPHIRQRIWFVADRYSTRCGAGRPSEAGDGRDAPWVKSPGLCAGSLMADAESGNGKVSVRGRGPREEGVESRGCGGTGELANAEANRQQGKHLRGDGGTAQRVAENRTSRELADSERGSPERRGYNLAAAPGSGEGGARDRERLWPDPWAGCELIPCTDGKARPVEPGTFPLAHGIPQRVGRLRAYGNAINPWTAAAFVRAYLDCGASDYSPVEVA